MPRINASTTAVELRPQGYYGETYIDNDSTATLYVKRGAGATATDYNWRVPPGAGLELEPGDTGTAQLTGVWSATNGAAQVTT